MKGTVRYDAVLFDLDGTLYDRDALVGGVVATQHAAFRDELAGVSGSAFVERFLRFDKHGYGNKLEGYREALSEWGLSPRLAEQLEEHFWAEYDRQVVFPDDTRKTLHTLRENGIKLGIITNGETVRQRRKLMVMGIVDAFDVVLISEAEGVRKPDREIFQRAIDRCGATAGRALFVGDHPEIDVAGAVSAGLSAVWKYVPYWGGGPDHVTRVNLLSEILPICFGAHDEATERSALA